MFDLFSGVYRGKKVLVTGHTGFKGSWLCIWLRELGADVYGYALPPLSNRDNFVTTQLEKKMNHCNGDIRNKEALQNYFNKVKPDIAFHLAAQPLVIDSYERTHYTFETNVLGTVNFFEAMRHCLSVKAAINVTTDKCYQNNEWLWGYRENEPLGGNDPYSASKACSELITTSYIKSFFGHDSTTHIASARAGNVVGGGDWAENRIIPDAIRAYETNTPLIVRNPDAIRPWQFVLEPLYGYLKLGEKLFTEGKIYSGAWNFGPIAYDSYSVAQMIKEVKKIIPQLNSITPEILDKPHEAGILKLDISKATHRLSWKPKLNFEETIRYTIEGYLQELQYQSDCYDLRKEQIKNYCNQ